MAHQLKTIGIKNTYNRSLLIYIYFLGIYYLPDNNTEI